MLLRWLKNQEHAIQWDLNAIDSLDVISQDEMQDLWIQRLKEDLRETRCKLKLIWKN